MSSSSQENQDFVAITGGPGGEDCEQLSESRYILAKYRLQQNVVQPTPDVIQEEDFKLREPIAPLALTPNVHGGEFHCNHETCCQLAWCLCVPCLSMSLCWIRCCERIYDSIGKYLTEKEEVSQLTCCTRNCCRL